MSHLDDLTKSLSGCKEFVIVVQDVLLWKETYYSYCIAGFVTVLSLYVIITSSTHYLQ